MVDEREKTSSTCLGLVIAGVIALVILGILEYPLYRFKRVEPRLQASCFSNLRSLATAMLSYATDSDGRLPPACDKPSPSLEQGRIRGSVDDLARYFPAGDWPRRIGYRNGNVLICPKVRSIYSYDLNPHVSGGRLMAMDRPNTLMIYEAGFITGSPAGPHFDGYHISFCDGHAQWSRSLTRTSNLIILNEVTKR